MEEEGIVRIQSLDNAPYAMSPVPVIYDRYWVTVRLPAGMTPEDMLLAMATLGPSAALNYDPFTSVNEFIPANTTGNPQVGNIYAIDILTGQEFWVMDVSGTNAITNEAGFVAGDGAVVLVELESDRFVFQAAGLNVPPELRGDGSPMPYIARLPEHGVREFGYVINNDGTVTFYTAGASLPSDLPANVLGGNLFQPIGWTRWTEGIGSNVTLQGGEVVDSGSWNNR